MSERFGDSDTKLCRWCHWRIGRPARLGIPQTDKAIAAGISYEARPMLECPMLLRVVGRLPWLCVRHGLGRQVSDKPQGRKPRDV